MDNAIVKPPVEQFGHLLLPLDGNRMLTGGLIRKGIYFQVPHVNAVLRRS